MQRPGLRLDGTTLVYALAVTEGAVGGFAVLAVARQTVDAATLLAVPAGAVIGLLFGHRYIRAKRNSE